MAKLSYKGTGRDCIVKIYLPSGQFLGSCRNQASRGSDYCLRHKHAKVAHLKALAQRGKGPTS